MAIDVSDFDSIEDLDIHYKKQLRKAPDEEAEAEVRNEWNEGKTLFWQGQAEKQALAVAKRDALDKYPSAKRFATQIAGKTPQEVEASAKGFHDAIEEERKTFADAKQKAADDDADQREAARQQYGSPVGAGGGTPIPPALEDAEAIKQRTWKKLAEGRGMQDAQSKMDFPRFASQRLREGVEQSQTNPSYRSFSRNSPDDKKIQDDRTARKNAAR